MTPKQEKYFKNYRIDQVPSKNGKKAKRTFSYIGDLYTWHFSDTELRRHRLRYAIWEAAGILLFAVSVIIRNPVNSSRLVGGICLLSFAVLIFEAIAVWTFSFGKLPYREDDFEWMDIVLQIAFLIRTVLMGAASLLAFINSFRLAAGIPGMLISISYLLCAAITLYLFLDYRKLRKKKKVIPSIYQKK